MVEGHWRQLHCPSVTARSRAAPPPPMGEDLTADAPEVRGQAATVSDSASSSAWPMVITWVIAPSSIGGVIGLGTK